MNSRISKMCQIPIKRNSGVIKASQMRLQMILAQLGLQSQDAEKYMELFDRNSDKNSQIAYFHLVDLLKKQNLYGFFRQTKQFNSKQKKYDLVEFCKIMVEMKRIEEANEGSDSEILNAFVALGGNQDQTGTVEKEFIIKVIKDQFELTFDIEELLEKHITGGKLNYSEFSEIFQTVNQSEKSLMSKRLIQSSQTDRKMQDQTLRIKYRDFERWFQVNGS